MSDLLPLLTFPLIATFGWWVSRGRPKTACRMSRLAILILGVLLVGLALSGWGNEGASSTHKWAGHGLVVFAWLVIPFIFGTGIQRWYRRSPARAIGRVFVLVVLLGIVMLASFTGYLGPSHVAGQGEETVNRFKTLHLFVLPSLIAILSCVTYRWWRPEDYSAS